MGASIASGWGSLVEGDVQQAADLFALAAIPTSLAALLVSIPVFSLTIWVILGHRLQFRRPGVAGTLDTWRLPIGCDVIYPALHVGFWSLLASAELLMVHPPWLHGQGVLRLVLGLATLLALVALALLPIRAVFRVLERDGAVPKHRVLRDELRIPGYAVASVVPMAVFTAGIVAGVGFGLLLVVVYALPNGFQWIENNLEIGLRRSFSGSAMLIGILVLLGWLLWTFLGASVWVFAGVTVLAGLLVGANLVDHLHRGTP